MTRHIALVLLALTLAIPSRADTAAAEADHGYFLSMRQKGELVWWGCIKDEQDRWYNVWICPGYVPPSRHAWKGLRRSGSDFAEYFQTRKYRDLAEQSGDCYEWAWKDCGWRFMVKGIPRVWKEDFREARERTGKRVFGWWLAYPWSFFTATVNTAVRLPLGVAGTALGTAAGTVLVPGYHLVDSSVKGVWHVGVDSAIVPVAGYAWNTVVAPPLALVGQKPAPARVDGFWVRQMTGRDAQRLAATPPPPAEADVASVAEWSRVLWTETESFQARLDAVDAETSSTVRKIEEQAREKKDEVRTQEQQRLDGLAADPRYEALAATARRVCQDPSRLDEFTGPIVHQLTSKAGLSRSQAWEAVYLLRRHIAASQALPQRPRNTEKTDPLKQVVRETGDVLDNPYPPETNRAPCPCMP
jgi:hypothetical protein